jgi:hypothetical protein
MRSCSRVVHLLFGFVVAVNCLVWAQTGTTSLRGTVSDKSGAAITGAKVTLSDPERGFTRTTTSGQTGEYEFIQLPPRTYLLTVEMTGFRRYEQKNVQLLVDVPYTVKVTLEVGAVSETVDVSAEGAVINTSDASMGNAFNEVQIKELPMEGRNVPDLLTLQNGVTYTGNRTDINQNADTRSGAVNGARSDQSNITLDGVDVNDNINGYAFDSVLPVTLDSVQEFRVTTTSYGADAGRSSGAQVSLVTKSGTNQYHGSLYEYLRNTYTSANDYFVKLAEINTGDPNKALQLNRNIFGGSLGGPILKDRMFIFLNYEGARQAEQQSAVRTVPSDALRDGVMQYLCTTNADGSLDTATCPGGNVQGNSGKTYAIQPGFNGLTPKQVKQMDPLRIGANSVVMNFFNTFPHGNDNSQGDGLNFIGYRFRGSAPIHKNWYIGRVDYKLTNNGNHSLFWRGALRNDVTAEPPYLPGTPPLELFSDNSSGYTVGYAALLSPTLVNSFRYGFTRQSFGNPGNTNTPVILFRGLNDNSTPNNSTLAYVYSRAFTTPLHNFVDDITWTKGRHTIQLGGNLRFIRNPRESFLTSFPSGTTNSSGLNTAGIANTSSPLDPGNNGLPGVDSSFNLSYNYPMIAMMGMVSQLNTTFNYDKHGNALPIGAPVTRRYGADEYEMYVQDAFRLRPNLTITYGLRYSLFSPPWETTGTQVAPTPNLGTFFNNRLNNMRNGIGSEADQTVTFSLAGAANGKTGFYNWDYHNFGPRLAFAYSPRPSGGWLKSILGDNDKTVIRGGAGIVYDRIGGGLLQTFDTFGAFGLSNGLTNSVIPSATTSPRLTSLTSVPCTEPNTTINLCPQETPGNFPFVFPEGGTGLAIYYGMDNTIKTPYSYTFNLTVGRQVTKDMTLEVSYVGRLSRRLLSQEDVAMPLDIVDKKSGVDYFAAARRMSEVGRSGVPTSAVKASVIGPTARYWQDMIKPLAPGDQYNLSCTAPANTPGVTPLYTTDPVQAMYDLFTCGGGPVHGFGDETTPLSQLDYAGSDFSGTAGILGLSGNYYPSVLGPNAFFNRQFHALFAWRSIGNANYNGAQVTLRRRMSHGVQFDFNYTYSKAIDISSDATRVTFNGGLSSGLGGIINSWAPNQLRAVADFDTTHQLNANWVVELPFGKGKYLRRNSGRVVDAVIGGWELSGLARWTSGFPVNISNGATWPTNWQLPGDANIVGHVVAHTTKFRASGGNSASVNLFPDPQGPTGIGAFGNTFPGQSGQRNVIRGPGFAGLDMGLSKLWRMPYSDHHLLKFRWEVFNVPNLTRFDVASITNGIDQGPAFGKYSGLLTNPRVMQFALRYEF